MDKSLQAINYADLKEISTVASGPYPDRVIQEANEDLEVLCETLKKLGVEVLRPELYDTGAAVSNGSWQTEGYYSYCPRDSVLVHGDLVIESPMPLRSRYLEQKIFKKIFQAEIEHGVRWLSAPRPNLADSLYEIENVRANTLTLKENEPCFDAANVLRAGYDLFYLVSNSGNKLGARWLQNILGSSFRVHLIEDVYAYMHLDSTISILRPGLVLLNPARINENNLPKPFRTWDKIWCADPVDIGYYGNFKNASTWIGMNLLMVNPSLALVEKNQTSLISQLREKDVEVIPLPMRHARTLGGAFHCVTLDLARRGDLECYFDQKDLTP
jgi:scyllo-inosamine-4-phosphate amidinotransferase 1